MVRLKSVGVLSAGKISGILYGGLALLFVPVLLVMAVVMTMVPHTENQPPAFMFVVFAVVAPFIYGAIGFVSGALAAFVYNLAAGWIGGLEMQFENPQAAQVYPPQVPSSPVSQG
jgi:hypothetical protein